MLKDYSLELFFFVIFLGDKGLSLMLRIKKEIMNYLDFLIVMLMII